MMEVVDVDAEPEVMVVAPPVASATGGEDADLALALSLQAGSQFLPKRKRGQAFSCGICLDDDIQSFKGYSVDGWYVGSLSRDDWDRVLAWAYPWASICTYSLFT